MSRPTPALGLRRVGQPYAVNLITNSKTPEHRRFQPFGQVPTYRDDEVAIFDAGGGLRSDPVDGGDERADLMRVEQALDIALDVGETAASQVEILADVAAWS